MTNEQLLEKKVALYHRLAVVAAKPFAPLRMLRLRWLNKRLDSLNRGLSGGKQL